MTIGPFTDALDEMMTVLGENHTADEEHFWHVWKAHRETIFRALSRAAQEEANAAEIKRNPGDWALVEIAIALDTDGDYGISNDPEDFDTAVDGLAAPTRFATMAFHMKKPKPKRYEVGIQDGGEDDGEIVESAPLTERLPADIA